jgi:hypothetical protein
MSGNLTVKTRGLRLPVHRLRLVLFVLLGFGVTLQAGESLLRQLTLQRVSMEKAPVLKNKRVYYSLDFTFDSAPSRYWIFYDQKRHKLVIDMYGAQLEAAPGLEEFHENFFRTVTVTNQKTAMSLSGMQSRIFVGADAGWHYEAATLDSATVRVMAWKILEPNRVRSGKNRGPIIYILTGASSLVAAFVLVLIVGSAAHK